MSQPTSLSALLAEYPRLKQFLQYIPTGDYTLEELFDFNPYKDGKDIEAVQGETISEPGEAVCIGVPIVQLDEMYKASLIVKAQLQLLVRLEQTGAVLGMM